MNLRIKSHTFKQMEVVLNKLPGEKCMLVDPNLIKPLDRTVSMKFLTTLSVAKVYKIQKLPPEASFNRLVYVIPPSKHAIEVIFNHTDVDKQNNIKRTRLVVFVPKQTVAMQYLLESRGILGGDLQTTSLSFGWIPLESDLFSLNLPELYTEYFLHGDTSWPHHFGQMLGQLLQEALGPSESIEDVNVHALGSAAQVTAAGLKSFLLNSNKTPTPRQPKDGGRTRVVQKPLVLLFSRNLDYFTPFMVPMTFEALIHEVLGVDNGVVCLPNVRKEDCVPQKIFLNSASLPNFKEVRDTHISTVHSWLRARKAQLDDSRTGVSFSLTAMGSNFGEVPGASAGHGRGSQVPGAPTTSSLSDLHSQLKPVLALRRDLTTLFICLEEVMQKMTKEERVEDLISAQVAILQSGSGGALAVPSGREVIVFGRQRPSDLDAMPPEAGTGSCAEDPTCQPVRLAFEWLSTNQGNKLTDAVRLLCLLSLTHDGLGEELYEKVHLAIQHTVGFSVLPLLHALRRLKLFSTRKDFSTLPQSNSKDSQLSLTQSSAEKLVASATGRLINRWKSTYNRLHRLLRLSLGSQACLTPDKPAVSPTYVFGGQHVPLVVRFVESLWASGLGSKQGSSDFGVPTKTVNPLLAGPELLTRDDLVQAFSLLPMDKESAKTTGTISLATEESTTDSSSQSTTQCASHGQYVLVVFVGGCTYAEVAALRFAAQRRCWRLLIATSQMLSSRSIIQQIGEAVL
uniref:Vacuolar protein sorting-associated protein 33B n=2 Tax=Schistocephalus solidus TaxID=70667 RepID=A0A0X3Q444_SCHSO